MHILPTNVMVNSISHSIVFKLKKKKTHTKWKYIRLGSNLKRYLSKRQTELNLSITLENSAYWKQSLKKNKINVVNRNKLNLESDLQTPVYFNKIHKIKLSLAIILLGNSCYCKNSCATKREEVLLNSSMFFSCVITHLARCALV